jgi:hypothetical protein
VLHRPLTEPHLHTENTKNSSDTQLVRTDTGTLGQTLQGMCRETVVNVRCALIELPQILVVEDGKNELFVLVQVLPEQPRVGASGTIYKALGKKPTSKTS